MRDGQEIIQELTPFLNRVNSIFFTFMQDMMKPEFSDQVPTAAVMFARDSDENPCVKFIFNPDFWDKLNYNEKIFVFIHEVLHVLFSHGKRGSEFFDSIDKKIQSYPLLNVAMDICINEIILEQYLSDIPRSTMPTIMEMICLIDSVFKEHSDKIEKGKNFQYYYQKYIEIFGKGSIQELETRSMDTHGFNDIDPELLEEIETMIDEKINDEKETEEADLDNDMIAKSSDGYSINKGAVSNHSVTRDVVKPKTSLEKYFDLAVSTSFQTAPPKIKTQWYGVNRRSSGILKDTKMNLPIRQTINKNSKHKVLAYCDVSGSCEQVSRKFISMINQLSESKYEKDIFVFADRVSECSISQSGKINYGYSGWGTNIRNVLDDFKKDKLEKKYDAVFVLTDGFYSNIRGHKDDYFSNWHFFIIDNGIENCPIKSKSYTIK